ncbi:uncharacterized protein LOC126285274 [Schistocerca gregaria]|uniref:uncharacterized protein LOC126285274 n=1 Tax=Schistocerca gregaria TaxID=7010 RepID=UPI00211EE975|nr:uncharacterized protein LOC126285274 [Schistocerca gregaria]
MLASMATWIYALALICIAFLLCGSGAADSGKAAPCPEPLYECPSANVTYHLYMPGNPDRPPKEVDESTAGSVRLYGLALKVLVHDFGGGPDDTFNRMLRSAYLSRGGTAVLTVDWSSLAAHRCGRKFAEAQAELVGACTARLLSAGAEAGALPPAERLHALGAGLGAWLALADSSYSTVASQGAKGIGLERISSKELLESSWCLGAPVCWREVQGDGVACCADPGKCSHELAAAYFAEGVWPGPGLRAAPCGDACRRNISLPELPPSEAARLASYTVPVGEDLPFTASGLLCAEAYSRPPFGRQKGQAGGLFGGGGGHLCWAMSGALLLYLLSRALAGRAEQHQN